MIGRVFFVDLYQTPLAVVAKWVVFLCWLFILCTIRDSVPVIHVSLPTNDFLPPIVGRWGGLVGGGCCRCVFSVVCTCGLCKRMLLLVGTKTAHRWHMARMTLVQPKADVCLAIYFLYVGEAFHSNDVGRVVSLPLPEGNPFSDGRTVGGAGM